MPKLHIVSLFYLIKYFFSITHFNRFYAQVFIVYNKTLFDQSVLIFVRKKLLDITDPIKPKDWNKNRAISTKQQAVVMCQHCVYTYLNYPYVSNICRFNTVRVIYIPLFHSPSFTVWKEVDSHLGLERDESVSQNAQLGYSFELNSHYLMQTQTHGAPSKPNTPTPFEKLDMCIMDIMAQSNGVETEA